MKYKLWANFFNLFSFFVSDFELAFVLVCNWLKDELNEFQYFIESMGKGCYKFFFFLRVSTRMFKVLATKSAIETLEKGFKYVQN